MIYIYFFLQIILRPKMKQQRMKQYHLLKRCIACLFLVLNTSLLPAQLNQRPPLDSVIRQEHSISFKRMNNYLLESKVDSAFYSCREFEQKIGWKHDSAGLFYANYMRMVIYNSLRNEDSVQFYKQQFMRYALNYSNYSLIGFSQLTLGKLLINQEKPEEAIAFVERAIQEFEHYPISSNLIESYITLAKCYGNQGQRKSQLIYLNKALELLQKSPASKENMRNEIATNLSLARLYNILKYNDKAVLHATQAYELTKHSEDNKSFLSECVDMLSFAPGISMTQKNEYLKEGLAAEMKSVKKDYYKRFAYGLAYNLARMNQPDSGRYYFNLARQLNYQSKNKTYLAAENIALFGASLHYQPDTIPALIEEYENRPYLSKDSIVYKREIAYRKKNYYFILRQFDSFSHYQTLYEEYDKLISGAEKTEITERLNVEFESERKAREILLLNKENELKELALTNSKINFTRVELENLKQRQSLLIKDLEIVNKNKTLAISKAERDRKTQELLMVNKDIEAKETQLALLEESKRNQALLAQQALIEQENKQITEKKNIWTGFLCSAALLGLVVLFYIQKNNQRNQRKSYEALIKSIEAERDRISSDLHDDIGSTLSSIAIYNELIIDQVKTKPELIPQLSQKISVHINELMHHTEDIIWSLKIGPHQNETISKRVQEYATELLDSKQIHSHIEIQSEVEQFLQHPEQRRNMLMIIKEAMNNCQKYSQAKNFTVQMKLLPNLIQLTLSDDGIGFDQNKVVFGDGIQNIRNRCKNLNGRLELKSVPAQGTILLCEIPISSYTK